MPVVVVHPIPSLYLSSIHIASPVSTGLTCYHCNSEFDPRCGDPFDSYSLGIKNCSLEEGQEDHLGDLKATLCRKTVQKGI